MKKLLSLILIIGIALTSCDRSGVYGDVEQITCPNDSPMMSALESAADVYEESATLSAYITRTFTQSINENMPDFIFELFALQDEGAKNLLLKRLVISDSSTGDVIQTISLPELALDGTIIVHDQETFDFALEDLTFSGIKGIRIFDRRSSGRIQEWIYLIYCTAENIFIHDTRLNDIPNARFDQENQVICGSTSAINGLWTVTYRYFADEPIRVATFARVYAPFNSEHHAKIAEIITVPNETFWFDFITEETLNTETMELEITSERFALCICADYDDSRFKIIAEYELDSEIGEQLAELIADWHET
jgi:hypothetical protein